MPVTGIAVTLNGGEGNDDLTGTDGADTINGGPGDDKLTGFKGNDAPNGEDGDDLIVWNNGDGSDKPEGGAGNDTAQLNGGSAGEHFVITGNGRPRHRDARHAGAVLPRHGHRRAVRPQRQRG